MIDEPAWFALLAPELAVVVAVLEEEHITRAAQRLGVPQPTVSRALRRVEQTLSVSLVQPRGRGIAVTAAGRALLPAARSALQALGTARRDLAEVIDPEHGEVSLAFLHTLGVHDVPRLLDAFRAAWPDVRFRLSQGAFDTVVGRLRDGSADVAVVAPLPPADAELAVVPLRSERLRLAVPREHRLAGRAAVDLRQVAGEPFVAMTPGHGMRTLFDELCVRAGFVPRMEFLGEDVATLRGLVGAGLGVAVLPPGPARTDVVELPIRRPAARRVIGAVWPANRTLPPAARRFVEFLRADGARVLAEP